MDLQELDNYEIRYRFYQENTEWLYFPKGEILDEYMEDDRDITYSEFSDWQESCNVDPEIYDIEYRHEYTYQELKKIAAIYFTNFSNINSNIAIYPYVNNKKINREYTYEQNGDIHIKLDDYYDASELLLYAYFRNYNEYDISFYSDYNFEEKILEKRIVPTHVYNYNLDSSYTTNENSYTINTYDSAKEENDFRTKISEKQECRYRRINTYRYKILKVYYDDNYYTNVDGYKKDYTDFKIFYKKDTEYIEVMKVDKEYIEVPKYIEIEKEVPTYVEIEKEIPVIETQEVVKTEYVYFNYKKYLVYIIPLLILSIILFLVIKKCRTN